jgi:hypothetical protein
MTFVKVASGILGTILAMVAIPLLVISIGMFSLTDGDAATLPTISATTSGRAMTFGDVDIDWDRSPTGVEQLTVGVEGDDLFIGIGRSTDVERFLASELPPARASIWITDAAGSDPSIEIAPDGVWTAVVMNADGSPGVDADVTVNLPATPVRVASAAVMGAGAMAAIAATLLFVVAFRRPRAVDQPVVERQPEHV